MSLELAQQAALDFHRRGQLSLQTRLRVYLVEDLAQLQYLSEVFFPEFEGSSPSFETGAALLEKLSGRFQTAWTRLALFASLGLLNYVQYYLDEEQVTQLRVAILLAARWGQLEVLELLTSRLPRFASFNEYFLEAVGHGQLLAAKLLRKGIDGHTLRLGLDTAAVAGYLEIVQYLLGEVGGAVSKEVAVEVASRGHLEVVRALFNKAPWGWEALEAAYRHGHLEVVRFLVSRYDNIWNVREYYAKAAEASPPDLMELLAQRLKELKLEQEHQRQLQLELERAASWESFKRRYGL